MDAVFKRAAFKQTFTAKAAIVATAVAAALMFAFVAVFAVLFSPLVAHAASASISIPVAQTFSLPPGIEREGANTYLLQALDSTHPLPEGAADNRFVFSLTGNQQKNIGPIIFTHAGLFTYEIKSDQAPRPGHVIDDTIYTIVIGVRNVDGGLLAEIRTIYSRTATSPSSAKLEAESIVFNKGYQPLASDPKLKADPPVIKMVQGNPAKDHTFTFRLEAQNAGQPMPEGAVGSQKDITITGNNRAEFGTWSYTEVGVFVYTVREIYDSTADYRFDTAVYTITDTVISENGQLVADRVVSNESGSRVSALIFINYYTGRDVEVQEKPEQPSRPSVSDEASSAALPPAGSTHFVQGPKTGDYADPIGTLFAMGISAVIALFTLFLIYYDRKGEKDYENLLSEAVAAC